MSVCTITQPYHPYAHAAPPPPAPPLISPSSTDQFKVTWTNRTGGGADLDYFLWTGQRLPFMACLIIMSPLFFPSSFTLDSRQRGWWCADHEEASKKDLCDLIDMFSLRQTVQDIGYAHGGMLWHCCFISSGGDGLSLCKWWCTWLRCVWRTKIMHSINILPFTFRE